VDHVLGDPGYCERARARAAEIARLDGVGRAADIVEEAFRTNAPLFA
jgi:UDP:flavonoid glycosyltransferase YjiC (YdhE family)